MSEISAVFSALALGLLSSVYPCTMATNLTALSWLASSAGDMRRTVLSGIAYALGRSFAYTALGLLLSWAALSDVAVADALKHYSEELLGPFLVLAGMFVAGLFRPGRHNLQIKMFIRFSSRLRGVTGAFLMGAVLALAFCPASTALFFGSIVIGIASGGISPIALPTAFGIGSALPVLVISVVFAGGIAALSVRFRSASLLKRRLPALAGGILIALGIYLSVRDIILA